MPKELFQLISAQTFQITDPNTQKQGAEAEGSAEVLGHLKTALQKKEREALTAMEQTEKVHAGRPLWGLRSFYFINQFKVRLIEAYVECLTGRKPDMESCSFLILGWATGRVLTREAPKDANLTPTHVLAANMLPAPG